VKKRKTVMYPGKQWKQLYEKGGLIDGEKIVSRKIDIVQETATIEGPAAQEALNDLKDVIQLLEGPHRELQSKERLTKKDAALKKRFETARTKFEEKVAAANARERELRDEFEYQREKLVRIALSKTNEEELGAYHPYRMLCFHAFNLDVVVPEPRRQKLVIKVPKRRRISEEHSERNAPN
jgi:hypothetical protein